MPDHENNVIRSNSENLPEVRQFDGHDWFSTVTSRRNLPHWELKGSTYFITTRVDTLVGKPFKNSDLARYLVSRLCQEHQKKYLLYAYVVMPDHFHIIIKPLYDNGLGQIMKNLKGSSAYYINKQLNRTGKFWQVENYDHLIRDGMYLREKWEYIRDNPVVAKLVGRAEDYPFSSFHVEASAD